MHINIVVKALIKLRNEWQSSNLSLTTSFSFDYLNTSLIKSFWIMISSKSFSIRLASLGLGNTGHSLIYETKWLNPSHQHLKSYSISFHSKNLCKLTLLDFFDFSKYTLEQKRSLPPPFYLKEVINLARSSVFFSEFKYNYRRMRKWSIA